MEVRVRYGLPGHEREYCVNIDGFNIDNFIPDVVAERIQSALPDTYVMNRGSRIEVMTDDQSLTETIDDIVRDTFADRPWLHEMRNRK